MAGVLMLLFVLGLLMWFGVSSSLTANRGSKRFLQGLDWNRLVEEMKILMTNPTACVQSVGAGAVPVDGSTVAINLKDPSGNGVFQLGVIGSVTLTKLSAKLESTAASDVFDGTLMVEASPTGGEKLIKPWQAEIAFEAQTNTSDQVIRCFFVERGPKEDKPQNQVIIGREHACGIKGNKTYCWGRGDSGQLGNADSFNSAHPREVVGPASPLVFIAGGNGSHSCGISESGGAYCWGANSYHQLGDGSVIPRNAPTAVSGLASGVTHIDAGYGHSCAVVNGAAKCWGWGSGGLLGNGATSNQSTPVNVTGLISGVTDVSINARHSCAIVNGAAKCWGDNTYGMLGTGNTSGSNVPQQVTGLTSEVTDLGVGERHSCAIVGVGIKCWGSNEFGQLGNGGISNSSVPVDVDLGGNTAQPIYLTDGQYHTCVLMDSGKVYCWGRNISGQLGDGTHANRRRPTAVTNISGGVVGLSASYDSTCALFESGIKCWGWNNRKQLGDRTNNDSKFPVDVEGF